VVVQFEVMDTGIALAPEAKQLLFRRSPRSMGHVRGSTGHGYRPLHSEELTSFWRRPRKWKASGEREALFGSGCSEKSREKKNCLGALQQNWRDSGSFSPSTMQTAFDLEKQLVNGREDHEHGTMAPVC